MPRYYVIAKEIHLYLAEVEAESEEKAREFGGEMEGEEFEPYDAGDWEIVGVELIPEPKPDLSKNQLSLF